MIEKYNRVNDAPKYQVTRVNQSTVKYDTELTLKHLGVYQSQKYGLTAYFDYQVEGDENIYRCSFPKYMINQIDEMVHDEGVMQEIKEGLALIICRHYTTRDGRNTMVVEFKDKVNF